MQVLIWFLCFLVLNIVIMLIKDTGVILGGIPTVILYMITFAVARFLCKLYVRGRNRRRIKKHSLPPENIDEPIEVISAKEEKPKIGFKDILKWISNLLSSHVKPTAVLTLVCAALFVISYIGCSACDTLMSDARGHYEETIVRYEDKSFSIGCGLGTCKYCKGFFESPKPTFGEWASGILNVENYCNDFEYYHSVSNAFDFCETNVNAFLILTLIFLTVLITSITCRYKFAISIKERRN